MSLLIYCRTAVCPGYSTNEPPSAGLRGSEAAGTIERNLGEKNSSRRQNLQDWHIRDRIAEVKMHCRISGQARKSVRHFQVPHFQEQVF